MRRPLVHVNIGCNKGFDFLATLEDLSGDAKYSPGAYRQRLEKAGIMFRGNGSCGQIGKIDSRLRPQLLSTRKVMGHCIEPAETTFQVLQKGVEDLQGIHVAQYVVGAFQGEVFFPNVVAGRESKGFSKTEGIPVPATTSDEYARQMGITDVDLLSIDTEGNGMNVLYGAINSYFVFAFDARQGDVVVEGLIFPSNQKFWSFVVYSSYGIPGFHCYTDDTITYATTTKGKANISSSKTQSGSDGGRVYRITLTKNMQKHVSTENVIDVSGQPTGAVVVRFIFPESDAIFQLSKPTVRLVTAETETAERLDVSDEKTLCTKKERTAGEAGGKETILPHQ
jgi:FkbM family methyltransferase